jgi:MFS transporter, DHA1 family, inner membrane transport protein
MATFSNKTINRIYLHSALHSFGENAGGIFVNAYFIKAGMLLPFVFCIFAAFVVCRFIMRRAVLPLTQIIGLRNTLMLGGCIEALSYLLLPYVNGISPMLGLYILIGSAGSVIYWTCLHAYVSSQGDQAARGRQVSTQAAVAAVVGVIAPATGGFLMLVGGAQVTFTLVTAVQLLASLSLLKAPSYIIKDEAPLEPKTANFARLLYFAEGLHSACSTVIWQVALFIALGERFDSYGGALALAGLVGATASLATGHLIDLGHGKRLMMIAYAVATCALLAKALSYDVPWAAVFATALGALVAPLTTPVLLTPLYNMAKSSPCPVRFNIMTEGGWDLGYATGNIIAAIVLSAGGTVRLPILVGLAAITLSIILLRRYYADIQSVNDRPMA